MDKQVKSYLEKLPSSQKEMCEKIHRIILNNYPNIVESFKNGVPWYESKFYIIAFKDHVNIRFSVDGLSQKEMEVFEGNGKYIQQKKFYSLDEINEKEIIKLLKIMKQ